MRVISITGASGYIGKYLVAELLRIGGYEIRVLLRSKQQAWIESKFDSRVEVIEGDINDSDSLQLLLKPGCTIINFTMGLRRPYCIIVRGGGSKIRTCGRRPNSVSVEAGQNPYL